MSGEAYYPAATIEFQRRFQNYLDAGLRHKMKKNLSCNSQRIRLGGQFKRGACHFGVPLGGHGGFAQDCKLKLQKNHVTQATDSYRSGKIV